MNMDKEKNQNLNLNESTRKILFICVGISLIFLALGFIANLYSGISNLSWPFTVTGLIVLLLTPILRLIVNAFLLSKSKDYKYTFIAVIVIALIIAGIFIGK